MNTQVQLWLPVFVSLFGTFITVVITAWLSTKSLSAQIEALRAEMKQGFAELRLEFHRELAALTQRVERIEEQRGLVRP